MDIRISGHQVETGEALREHVTDKLTVVADRYFDRAVSTQVTFGKGPHDHSFTCDVVLRVPQGVVLKGSGQAASAHPAFDQAAEKIETQLRRYKDRLRDRSASSADMARREEAEYDAGYTVFAPPSPAEEPVDNPPIVAEMQVDIPEASVSDAVMILDLRNTNALLFRNGATQALNMVYRRGDGTIGWVEPRQ